MITFTFLFGLLSGAILAIVFGRSVTLDISSVALAAGEGLSFSDFSAILLTAVAVLLAIVAFIVAIGAFFGAAEIQSVATRAAVKRAVVRARQEARQTTKAEVANRFDQDLQAEIRALLVDQAGKGGPVDDMITEMLDRHAMRGFRFEADDGEDDEYKED